MMPDMYSDSLTLKIEMPLGTKYDDTKAVALAMQEAALMEIKGAKSITSEMGSTGSNLFKKKNSDASVTVNLDLDDPLADSADTIKAKFRAYFPAFPDAVFSFESGRKIMSSSDIDIVLRADDLQQSLADARTIKAILENDVTEVEDVLIDMNEGLPQLDIKIDRQRAYNMGLNIASIAQEIAASMNGVTATTLRHSGTEYDVILQLAKEDRYAIPDLGNIFVRSSKGILYPVSNFAALEKTMGPVEIKREDQARIIHITANVKEGYKIGDTQNKIQKLLEAEGINCNFSGAMADVADLMMTFVKVILLALFLVFGVMAGQYESFKDPFINFCTIPLMVVGVVLIHLLTGVGMNTFTMIGFVMLAGIVLNNGILLVDYTNSLTRNGMPLIEACIEAGRSRFRPILITTLTTMLGLAPMAFHPGKSSALVAPMGLAIFGGLSSSTLITLFFIPVLYSIFHNTKKSACKGVDKSMQHGESPS
jgi:HAE1 family hydrophobic/amphiphilic exporter-1